MGLDRKLIKDNIIKSITIKQTPTGEWLYSLRLWIDKKEFPETPNNPTGIDIGVKDFVATSKGELISPDKKKLRKLNAKLKIVSNKFSKTKNPSRKEYLRLIRARLYKKKSNYIRDFLHKVSTKLVTENQGLVIENLTFGKWKESLKPIRRVAQDYSYGSFISMLEYKSDKFNKILSKVSAYRTSQTCPNCYSHIGPESKAIRHRTCSSCNSTFHVDVGASQVILQVSKGLDLRKAEVQPKDSDEEFLIDV